MEVSESKATRSRDRKKQKLDYKKTLPIHGTTSEKTINMRERLRFSVCIAHSSRRMETRERERSNHDLQFFFLLSERSSICRVIGKATEVIWSCLVYFSRSFARSLTLACLNRLLVHALDSIQLNDVFTWSITMSMNTLLLLHFSTLFKAHQMWKSNLDSYQSTLNLWECQWSEWTEWTEIWSGSISIGTQFS